MRLVYLEKRILFFLLPKCKQYVHKLLHMNISNIYFVQYIKLIFCSFKEFYLKAKFLKYRATIRLNVSIVFIILKSY